jgi:hypothetical protein
MNRSTAFHALTLLIGHAELASTGPIRHIAPALPSFLPKKRTLAVDSAAARSGLVTCARIT